MVKKREQSDIMAEDLVSAYSKVVNSFDSWLHLLVNRGGSEKELLELIKSRLGQNASANVDFYNSLAKTCDKEENYSEGDHYRLIASLYGKVCKNQLS